ncbi:MAG: hypothetical protein FWH18_02530 [Marinilabiliaceae bacterium]|nr:hypothetical protein [Marinilabiliaceae bacterium]
MKFLHRFLPKGIGKLIFRFTNKKFICPFCFNKRLLSEIEFRCENENCFLEEDKKLADFQKATAIRMNKTFPATATSSIQKEAQCPDCKQNTTTRICPECHNTLPFNIGKYPEVMFAFIGAKETGKSHYIAVLINTIETKIATTFNADLSPLDENTQKKYREEFYSPLYQRKEVINITKSARTDYNTRMPLIYTLKFSKKSNKKITNVSTLTFFDTAGEDLNDEETMRTENKYIFNSQGIILLIDPLQIHEIREVLKSKNVNVNLPKENEETKDIINRVVRLIRKATGLTDEKRKIKTPIAIVFSKIDAIKEILEDNTELFNSNEHNGYFDIKDANNIGKIIETCINDWGGSGKALINKVKVNFKSYAFFGISALGSNPHGTTINEQPQPIRVEDPFLWLLYKNKVINSNQKMILYEKFRYNTKEVTEVLSLVGKKVIEWSINTGKLIAQLLNYFFSKL